MSRPKTPTRHAQDRPSYPHEPAPPPDERTQDAEQASAEQAVLGAMMLSTDAITHVTERIAASDYYQPRHGTIHTAILALHEEGTIPDPVAVLHQLRNHGEVRPGYLDALYLHACVATVPTVANAAYYAARVAEAARVRNLREQAVRLAHAASLDDPARRAEIVDQIRDDLANHRADRAEHRALPVLTVKELREQVATGPITYMLEPVWPGDAYGVIAAEDKAGKSWAVIDMAIAVAAGSTWMGQFPCLDPGPVLLFAGEGGSRNLVRRIDAVSRFYDIDPDTLDFQVATRVPHLVDPDHLAEVDRHLREQPRRLVILDPLYLAARGANGADLYAMGEHLEGIQHVCQTHGAALVVVTHFNKTGVEKNGKNRITGAGPAAWGRVLATAAVEMKTAQDGRTQVVLGWDFIGGEIPDTELLLRRTVWADRPEDLSSPLNYQVERIAKEEMGQASGPQPAPLRVLAVLRAATGPLTVREIGDRLAAEGRPLKVRTIQEALQGLTEYVDSREIDARGTCEFWIQGRA